MPHWLGSIIVEDLPQLDRMSGELVARGGTVLGPTFPTRDGGHAAVLRDPGGAIVGLSTNRPLESPVDVAWHVLSTNNLTAAMANYKAVFGWSVADEPSLGPYGTFHAFRWDEGQQNSAGAMWDIAGRPEVHPHWLFFFSVASLETAVDVTRAAGGTAMDPIHTPTGKRMVICEDPQGAAFGLAERGT